MSNPVDQKLSPTAATESVTSLPDKEISTSSLHTTLPLDVSNADRGAVFGNSGALNKFYRPIDTYEGIHRFDPEAEWTEAEEKKIVRKIDYRICSWCCLMFAPLYQAGPHSHAHSRIGSSPCSWIAATFPKRFPTTCSATLV